MKRKLLLLALILLSCSKQPTPPATPVGTPPLTAQDVARLTAQAVNVAVTMNELIVVGITDREGNVLGRFAMTGATIAQPATQPVLGELAKARTAAYLSSNQHAFTPLTACFITRSHFPPPAPNTPAGPLFGVPVSQLAVSDVQPNGAPTPPLGPNLGPPYALGLTSISGGIPVYVNGLLAGGLGVSGGSNTVLGVPGGPGNILLNQMLNFCTGISQDEVIALTAVAGYAPPANIIGSTVSVDGFQLLYNNTNALNFAFTFTSDSLAAYGTWLIGPLDSPPAQLPASGILPNFPVRSGQVLTADDVSTIINTAVATASRTRAGIRQPSGSRAQVFIAVCDLNGDILGIYRTPDATVFSLDVSAQKARTAVAFSDPNDPLGQQFRGLVGLPGNSPLAVSTRAVGFLSQRYFPPGIDGGTPPGQRPPSIGPLYQYTDGQNDFIFQINTPVRDPIRNGIQIFPGGIPLYKNGVIAGGIGISGDGVDQDDYIATTGAGVYNSAPNIRTDQYFYQNVRLPWVKFPRNPENL